MEFRGSMPKAGRCHICGKYRRLTDEHIPPQSALNRHPSCLYTFEEALRQDDQMPWEFEGKKGRPMGKGILFPRLCMECNCELLGSNYVPAYSEFVRQTYIQLERGLRFMPDGFGTFEYHAVYPLRIVKQVVAMFLGINAPEIGDAHPELRDFVMRTEQRGVSEDKYGLNSYVAGGGLLRYCGLSVLLSGFDPDSGRSTRAVSELATFPMGFLLELDPKKKETRLTDILPFTNKYYLAEKCDIRVRLPFREVNTMFPLDYRSKKEVTVDYLRTLLDQAMGKY